MGGAVDRRLPRQPGGRGGVRHLLLDSSTSPPSSRGRIGSNAPVAVAGRQPLLQRRHLRRLRRPAAHAGQRRRDLLLQPRLAQPQRQGRLRLPDRRIGLALQLSQQPVLHRRVVQPGGRHLRCRCSAATTCRAPRSRRATTTPLYAARQVRRDQPAGSSRPACASSTRPGSSDLGADTVDTTKIAPRVSASFDISGDGKTIVTGSYGRFYTGIIQSFSDGFAGVPQQGNYDNYAWNGSSYVFQNSIRVGGSSFLPNPDLEPSYLDEFTVGFQRQFGRTMAAGVRFIAREWNDLIDDIRTFNPDGTIKREVLNYDAAERSYRGVQVTFEKRFASNWNAAGELHLLAHRGQPLRADLHQPRRLHRRPVPHHARRLDRHRRRRSPAARCRTAPTRSAGRSTTGRTTSRPTPPTSGRSVRSTCRWPG